MYGISGTTNSNQPLSQLTHLITTPQQPPLSVDFASGEVEEYARVPAWSEVETRELIRVRGGLEMEFNVAKRNKGLWEVVAGKIKELGFRRSAEQCKCKWKNLVTRYKAMETSDRDNARSFPYFDELHTLFTRTSTKAPQTLFDPEATSGQSKKRVARMDSLQSLEELSEDEDEFKDEKLTFPPRKREKRSQTPNLDKPPTSKPLNSGNNSIQEILRNFFQQQQMIDTQWRQLMDKHACERQLFEQEWRQSMEKLEMERMRIEQSWREKEDQRKIREESRAERRDALLTLLLNKLEQ